ncbi:MAG: hypothetical protein WEB58_21440 [Planctomycetaceae bacterium]
MVPISDDDFRPYTVETPPSSAPGSDVPTFDIPLNEPILERIDELTMSSWIRAFARDPVNAWEERIKPRSNAAASERIIAASLGQFKPASILLHGPHAWCGFVPRDCGRGQASLYYIGERHETNVFVDTFKELNFKNSDELAGLLHFLSGFHESSRLMSGAFYSAITEAEIITQEVVDEEFYGCNLKRDWNPCVAIYVSAGGDPLLVNRSGKVAWWEYGGPDIILDFCSSIEELAKRLAFYWQEAAVKYSAHQDTPSFDPYTSEESWPYQRS